MPMIYSSLFCVSEKVKEKSSSNIFCKEVSCTASLLPLCTEWELQSQMVNKCSYGRALHKTRLLHRLLASFAADGSKRNKPNLCCQFVTQRNLIHD